MAKLILPLVLLVALQGYDVTATYDSNHLQSLPSENGDVCQDCTQIFTLLVDMLTNADLQKKILGGIDALCAHLPGPAAKVCKEEVDTMLPLAITFVTGVAKPSEVCKMIGLCGSDEERERMLSYFANEVLQAALKSDHGEPATTCSFCIFFFKTLEELLPKERTEGAVIKLLEEICHILPSTYRDQCEVIVDKYSKTVLDAILGYATPQAICNLIHLCKGQEVIVDPCTLTAYRCKDVSTALKCGTLFYCQKFAWKPLSYNTI
ncbi:surfactant protein Ba [Xiphophorus couchianus]|uniref:surfactant protein Ba n=1 Tax=Xiphophorus couchianus TaxID=32473 RepID=UPI0010160C47|nr:prosaposin-like [Xiphophorus couchianus]